MAKVVSFINYKGGVGKTTTTYHVGCSLAYHHQKRVLVIDIDPQTNLTFLCAPFEKWQEFKKRAGTIATMYQRFQKRIALDTKRYTWTEPIQIGSQRLQKLDLIPCDIELLGEDLGGAQVSGSFPTLELLRRNSKEFLRERRFLATAVKEVNDKYDYILIDCPPNLYLMTQNALIASDWHVVTAIPDHLSTIGLSILQQKVRKIEQVITSAETLASEGGTGIKMAKFGGIVFVKVRSGGEMITNTHMNTMARVRTLPGVGPRGCFSDYTTELIGYGEAAENSLPVWLNDSTNAKRAAKLRQYEKITEEFLRRF